jgi:hypothetical protein
VFGLLVSSASIRPVYTSGVLLLVNILGVLFCEWYGLEQFVEALRYEPECCGFDPR